MRKPKLGTSPAALKLAKLSPNSSMFYIFQYFTLFLARCYVKFSVLLLVLGCCEGASGIRRQSFETGLSTACALRECPKRKVFRLELCLTQIAN